MNLLSVVIAVNRPAGNANRWATEMSVPYQLHNKDCAEVIPSLSGVKAVITDPPYGLGMRTVSGGTSKNSQTKFIGDMKRTRWDDKPPSKLFFDELLKVGENQIIWGGNYFELPPSRCILVWDKMTYIPTMSRVEIAWTSMDRPAMYKMINSNLNDRVHPTQKPVELLRWCIELVSSPDDVIFDPFMGSGTTGVAALQLGRKFIGCEIDTKYFAIAEKRIKQAAQQPALLHVAQQSVQRTGGESGQQNLFTVGNPPPAKVTAKSPRR